MKTGLQKPKAPVPVRTAGVDLGVRVPRRFYGRLKLLAKQQGRSLSQLVLLALNDFLEDHEYEGPPYEVPL